MSDRACGVTVCRGCCCGSLRKHPDVDHRTQVDRLQAAARRSGGRVRVQVSDCLDACEHSNVVVMRPSRAGRRRGGRPVWLGWVLDEPAVAEVVAWVEAGGPGMAEPPASLTLHEFRPSRHAVRAFGT